MMGRLIIWALNFFRKRPIDAEIDKNREELMRERVRSGHRPETVSFDTDSRGFRGFSK